MAPVVNGSSISLAPITEEENVVSREARLVMKKLKSVLYRGVERFLTCESVILSKNTLRRASQDIIDLSQEQPSGLRGTVIDLYLGADDGSLKKLAQLVADSKNPTKTILKLTLYKQPESDKSTLRLNSSYHIERSCIP